MSKITCFTDEQRLRVCVQNVPVCTRHHAAHMLKHVCAWCRYKRGRFERKHGDVLSGHTEFRCVSHTNTPHHTAHTPHHNTRHNSTPQHNTTQHNTPHNTQQHTETETDRDRQRQRKKTEKEDRDRERIEDGRGETRQEKRRRKRRRQDNRREKIHFQCGGAWPFLVGGVNRLVNFVDDRDLCLLYRVLR